MRTAALFRSSLALALAALTGNGARAQEATPGATPASANLGAVKQYVADEAVQQKTVTAYLVQIAQRYDDLARGPASTTPNSGSPTLPRWPGCWPLPNKPGSTGTPRTR